MINLLKKIHFNKFKLKKMKIIVRLIDLEEITLDVEPTDTIENIKAKIKEIEGISLDGIVFYFKMRRLQDYKTVADYNIKEHSIIKCLNIEPNIIAGEFGSCSKVFVDPEKAGPTKLKLSSDAPFYRTVTKGMNLMGICENKNCLAFKKQIVHMFGFGSFDLINDMKNKPPICPSCEFPLRQVDTCAFWKCKYSYEGVKYENKQLKNVNYSNSNNKEDAVDYFDPGDKGENYSTWLELKITASKL